MASSLRILMLAAEAHPFAKVGGLADVMGALPRSLSSRGHHVIVALPLYRVVKAKPVNFDERKDIGIIDVPIGDQTYEAKVFTSTMPMSKAEVLLIDNPNFFDREGVYNDPSTGVAYDDNAERFIFFTRAALEASKRMGFIPDIIHCHDNQTGFVPAWLRHPSSQVEFPDSTRVIFTIHNLAYQGVYPKEIGYKAGFGEDALRPMGAIEFNGGVNMMKAGICFADLITTVSPTYAKEIQTPEYGYGLEGVLRTRAEDLVGILNGADYSVWNPETDQFLPYRYSLKKLNGKQVCKAHLVKQLGIDASPKTPIIGMISRLVSQKGFDILIEAFERIIQMDYCFAILGLGDLKYHQALKDLEKRFPGKVSVTLAFDEELAHLIEAGSDIFLMPSRYEPCGLNQMYSMKYGTVPVVRATGGLADTVVDFDESSDSTGFVFKDYTANALVNALERARKVFDDKTAWEGLVRRGMSRDFSWDRSASQYESVYLQALQKGVASER